VETEPDSYRTPWRRAHGELTDKELELIAQVVPTYCGDGGIGLLAAPGTRDMVNVMLSVTAAGCQWRALPVRDPQGEHRAPLPTAVAPRGYLRAEL